MPTYDDIRDSTARADLIHQHIPAGSRVLDFGAYRGVISAKLASHGHAVTAVAPELPDLPGVTCIKRTMTPDDIRQLGQFDVALCLSVLHHLPDWPDYVAALKDAAYMVFVETVSLAERKVKGKPGHRQALIDVLQGRTLGFYPGKDSRYQRPLILLDGR
jgi:2-polyprenyl-3-methyl-5-hydroxy-6-metoxy-1,4-benzoquinol methylase